VQADAGKFLTGFTAVAAIAIPSVLAHAQVCSGWVGRHGYGCGCGCRCRGEGGVYGVGGWVGTGKGVGEGMICVERGNACVNVCVSGFVCMCVVCVQAFACACVKGWCFLKPFVH
jgi:hypothetical protein